MYTVVIALRDGGDTAMRILGQDELAFTGEAGSGVAFRSALWHRTERAGAGVWKLALFYGYLLKGFGDAPAVGGVAMAPPRRAPVQRSPGAAGVSPNPFF